MEKKTVRINIPNYLTFGRILIVPILVISFYLPFSWNHILTTIIYAIACITDWFDGMLARYLNQVSPLGAFLDPVADKLLVATVLILLVSQQFLPYITIPAVIIVGREIVISALREWMSEYGQRASVAVSIIGKIKTIVQMFSLGFLLYYRADMANVLFFTAKIVLVFGYVLLYTAAILTLWSMVMYLKAAWPELMSAHEK